MTRFWIPVLLVLLNGLLVADVAGNAVHTGPSAPVVRGHRGESAPARAPEPLRASAAVAANEFYATMMIGQLPPGAAPAADQDCQGGYEWMRDRGAQLIFGLRMRVWLAASRYTQVLFRSASLRVVGHPQIHYDTDLAYYTCGNPGRVPYPGDEDAKSELVGVPHSSGLWFMPPLGIPSETSTEWDPPSSWSEPFPFDVRGTGTASFTIDVTIPGYVEPVDFVVDLRLRVNGEDRAFVLRDGDRPFRLFPDPGGAGFSPDQYLWCPGAPGRLERQRGEDFAGSLPTC